MTDEKTYIGYKIKLYPTPEQEEIFKDYFGACRYVYNLGIDIHNNYYQEAKNNDDIKYKTLSFFALNNKFTQLKKEDQYQWLNNYDSTSLKMVLNDVITAYKKFFDKRCNYPKYKKRKNHHQMFPIRADRIWINQNSVRIPSIGTVYCGNHNHPECIGKGNIKSPIHKEYYNTRVIYDGYSYWLSFTMIEEENVQFNSCNRFKNNDLWQHKDYSEPIGIDLGCKKNNWIVDSNGNRISRPDYSKEDKRIAKYQRKLAIKRRVNKEKRANSTVANKLEEPNYTKKHKYTKNEEKILKKLNKAYKRKFNKIENRIHEYACSIIQEKPSAIVLEDLDVKGMLIPKSDDIPCRYRKNHNKNVKDSILYAVKSIIQYKAVANNIPVLFADREYPSSQLCSCCGHRQKIGTSRVYKCPVCGNEIDRDDNAALNLKNVAYYDFNQYEMIV
ncbi:MAG: RNA-guided endonuclease TnpB family protein [Romboutsia timonensis]|uniref:RNA-guided endonuclease InsQ/TnpB family protein n=1 Tax=Romboutsia timonensis TaxID=1776391 RepID=UPI002A74B0A9|nr:RNA-guided endonuclease TnpB family protein [Romboutsia timonensis]MDY2882080.1 RNA-guided endonuclease TnpB family protein [Romboutsia timonensis]